MTERTGSAGSPLAGRLLEQDQLGALLDRAASGEAQAILVAGSAGMGKTTLVTATTSGRGAVRLVPRGHT
jgi:predicted ATPase